MTNPVKDYYGKRVRVAEVLLDRDYTPEGIKHRTPGAVGTIKEHSDSHGLCFKVIHDDGSYGWYDPDEFECI